MPASKRSQAEFDRRGEMVRVTLLLERGALEDLQALCEHHYGRCSRSEVVRRAVTWLLAREAMQVVRAHEIDRRRAERAAEEARALEVARAVRDEERAVATLSSALAVARRHGETTGGVG